MNKTKIVLITSTILLIAIIAALGSIRPTNSTTTKSATVYKDDLFQIDIPQGFLTKTIKDSTGYSVFIFKGNSQDDFVLCQNTALAINVQTNGPCGSLAYKHATIKQVESSTTIAGQNVKKHEYFVKEASDAVEIQLDQFSHQGKLININYYVTPEEYYMITETKNAFEEALKTFK